MAELTSEFRLSSSASADETFQEGQQNRGSGNPREVLLEIALLGCGQRLLPNRGYLDERGWALGCAW